MARPRSEQNARIKLCINRSLSEQLDAELEYLGIPSHALRIEEKEIENRADFLRQVIDGYARRSLDGGPLHEGSEGEVRNYIPFYLNRRSRSLWDSCIRQKVCSDYNDLANRALSQYFLNRKRAIDAVRLNRVRFRELLRHADPNELREFSR